MGVRVQVALDAAALLLVDPHDARGLGRVRVRVRGRARVRVRVRVRVRGWGWGHSAAARDPPGVRGRARVVR